MSLELPRKRFERRSCFLKRARAFFEERGLTEIDCFAFRKKAPIDAYIDVIEAEVLPNIKAFLHTSPEYELKRLLALGVHDPYFLGHVFRKNDLGRYHHIEFLMAEWYRKDFILEEMIEETAQFISLFIPNTSLEILSYDEAFERFLGIDLSVISSEELKKKAILFGGSSDWDDKTIIHFLLSQKIEPHLGKKGLTALTHYPKDEAALAQTTFLNGKEVAMRFEIYKEGVELANGYQELSDAKELKNRFEKENQRRKKEGKEPYLLDETFLKTIDQLPSCSGVSVGLDRVWMLSEKASSLQQLLSPLLDDWHNPSFTKSL